MSTSIVDAPHGDPPAVFVSCTCGPVAEIRYGRQRTGLQAWDLAVNRLADHASTCRQAGNDMPYVERTD